ncbi:unnamed protein product [Pleuronectes platessa]|uniref:Uncharacterized protein n=1 Tax=Pleuronectes platessa TaxID=8262 RepID=A0A9N7V8M4_PLEPL|nr:unnamed protein product [Pleuronectes platessa]
MAAPDRLPAPRLRGPQLQPDDKGRKHSSNGLRRARINTQRHLHPVAVMRVSGVILSVDYHETCSQAINQEATAGPGVITAAVMTPRHPFTFSVIWKHLQHRHVQHRHGAGHRQMLLSSGECVPLWMLHHQVTEATGEQHGRTAPRRNRAVHTGAPEGGSAA